LRRSDREIKDPAEIEEILKRRKVCHIALCKENEPYVVPMNYAWRDGTLYLHSAREGKKVEFARQNPYISFCVVSEWEVVEGPVPCSWTTHYRSVMGSGRVEFVEDAAEKAAALEIFMEHYTKGPFEFPKAALDRVLVWKIRADSLTGKKNV
jgi:nitroimidazol reductase NimA-like FMN-containing flavoprotein (pyridoxamine 5'-phosphate oxidase superfamily)